MMGPVPQRTMPCCSAPGMRTSVPRAVAAVWHPAPRGVSVRDGRPASSCRARGWRALGECRAVVPETGRSPSARRGDSSSPGSASPRMARGSGPVGRPVVVPTVPPVDAPGPDSPKPLRGGTAPPLLTTTRLTARRLQRRRCDHYPRPARRRDTSFCSSPVANGGYDAPHCRSHARVTAPNGHPVPACRARVASEHGRRVRRCSSPCRCARRLQSQHPPSTGPPSTGPAVCGGGRVTAPRSQRTEAGRSVPRQSSEDASMSHAMGTSGNRPTIIPESGSDRCLGAPARRPLQPALQRRRGPTG